MKYLTKTSLLISAFAILISCGKKESTPEEEAAKLESPKEIAMAVLDDMEAMMEVSATVTDAASATKAAEKMASISANMKTLAAQLTTMEKPSAEMKEEIEAEMEKRMDAAMEGLTPPSPEDINIDEAEQIQEIMSAAQEKFEAETSEAQKTFENYFRTDKDIELESTIEEVAPVE